MKTSDTKMMKSLPREAGFRMPAEWENHEATWIAWPHNVSDWPGKFAPIPWIYADVVRHLHRGEIVRVAVLDQAHENRARRVLQRSNVDLSRVEFHQFPTDRVWTRDSAPIFVKSDKQVGATNWHFNAWAKYADWKNDDQIGDRICSALGVPQWKPVAGKPARSVVLEGGSIDVNGSGLMLTTEECLLSDVQQRNPGLSREDLEQVFLDYLGVTNVIWLNKGIAGDDTHGHVDDLARFVSRDTVVIVSEDDKSDPNYEPLAENLAILHKARNEKGKPLKVITLPMPDPVVFDGRVLPASYANFYIGNDVVLVPTFSDPKDREALQILQDLFPDRDVVGIHCRDFVWGLGTMHCMTQQQPA